MLHRYSTFVNWELWWPNFPILVYFKETQTKPDGQVHFFPVIFVSSSSAPTKQKIKKLMTITVFCLHLYVRTLIVKEIMLCELIW